MILELIEKLTRKAGQDGLDFLVIGGHAMMHHGYARMTLDLDLLARESQRQTWAKLLQTLGYRVYAESPAFIQFAGSAPDHPPVDMMFVHDDTWDKLRAEATAKQSLSVEVLVPSVRHLIALKLHAAVNPTRRSPAKDWGDIEELVRRHKLDPHDPEFAALVRRYGGEDALEKIAAIWDAVSKESNT